MRKPFSVFIQQKAYDMIQTVFIKLTNDGLRTVLLANDTHVVRGKWTDDKTITIDIRIKDKK